MILLSGDRYQVLLLLQPAFTNKPIILIKNPQGMSCYVLLDDSAHKLRPKGSVNTDAYAKARLCKFQMIPLKSLAGIYLPLSSSFLIFFFLYLLLLYIFFFLIFFFLCARHTNFYLVYNVPTSP